MATTDPPPADVRMRSHLHSPFGTDRFGRAAERFARFFGTPKFILGQTVVVAVWIALNAVAVVQHWDPYPFILLNLAFSTQAAYAAPLILLAQTRQADRDKAAADDAARVADAQRRHAEDQSGGLRELLQTNTALTRRAAALIDEVHAAACGPSAAPPSQE
jgi:uncharacterized membrane protein